MRIDRAALARAALAAIVLLALAGAAGTLQRAVSMYHGSGAESDAWASDRASRHEERFGRLREHLPPRGVVGYLSDGAASGTAGGIDALRDYFLTQYSLAPLIVVRRADLPLVVGNYSSDLAELGADRSPLGQGFTVLVDLGDGVVLLEGPRR